MVELKVSQKAVKLLKALSENNIKFAHWKGNSHLLESLEGKTDVELLIHPKDRPAFEKAMEKLGFKKLLNPTWNTYPNVEDWLGFDYDSGALLHIHTHFAITTSIKYPKYFHLPWLDTFFKHLKRDEQTGWPIPKPELEVIVLLLRIWSKTSNTLTGGKQHELLLDKKNEVIELLKNTEVGFFQTLCDELQLKAPKDLIGRVERIKTKGNPTDILNLARHFSSQVTYSNASPVINLKSLYFKYYLKTAKAASKFTGPFQQKKMIPGGGKVIALIGSDGSGKSTLSNDIIKWLTFKLDTHYFYMGKHPYIRSYNKEILSKSDLFSSKKLLSRVLRKIVGNFYYVIMIKQKADMLQLAKKMSKQGSIIICDRFPQTNFNGINDGPKLQSANTKWSSQIEMKLFNKVIATGADLVFRLQISPEIAYQRKPDHSYDIITQKCENINKITFTNSTIIDLDASVPYDQVLLATKREIWKNL